MNPSSYDPTSTQIETPHPVDTTLRLIANLPVPEGLEERVHTRLRLAPRTARLLAWPLRTDTGWMRSAAAAAIVVVVAGGGWGVYSRVEHPQQPVRVIAMPATGTSGGGFGNAGAMRTPQTLNKPVLKHRAKGHPGKAAKKAPVTQTGQPGASSAPVAPIAEPVEK